MAVTLLSCAILLSGCASGTSSAPGNSSGSTTGGGSNSSVGIQEKSGGSGILSVETYNRTGKIQKEEFYASGTSEKVDYTVEYSYDDAGHLTEVKRTGGELGTNRPLETYLYSGNNCTQHVTYDSSGSTQKAEYRNYDKNGQLTKERVVTMLSSSTGTGYVGKSEDITEYDENGLAVLHTLTAPGEWSKNEYGYDPSGKLITDNYYVSSDGETWVFFQTTSYTYDDSGNLTRESQKEGTGTVFHVRIYEYDSTGNLLRDAVYSADDLAEEHCLSMTSYEYNSDGLCTFRSETEGTSSVQTFYEYDAGGNCTCVSETSYTGGTRIGTTVTKTEYDSRSNPVRETVTEPDGTVMVNYSCSYEYYEDGKIKKKSNYAPA